MFSLSPPELDSLEEFCHQNPLSPYWSLPIWRLLHELRSSERCVLDLRDQAGQRWLAGVVVDITSNKQQSALLEILGLKAGTPPEVLAPCLERALEVATAAGRGKLEFYSEDTRAGWAEWLKKAGFIPHHCSLVMERESLEPLQLPIPEALKWHSLDQKDILAYYRLVQAAFAEDPGMQLTDQASFEKTSLEHPIPIRVLWAENTPIGLARVRLEGRIGHIDTIGRHPSYKARGAGPLLLQEAIRLLLERGSPEFFRLGVTAENRPAVQLYSRYGFKIRESWTSWLKGV